MRSFRLLPFSFKNPSNPSENLLFLFPKKSELTKNEPVNQKKNLIQRQDQQEIYDGVDKSAFFHAEEVQNRGFDK